MSNKAITEFKANIELCATDFKAREILIRKNIIKGFIGDLINPDQISDRFRNLLRKHNLKHIRFHDLRHSCASLLVASKVPMKNIQEWLGHSNFNTTVDVYSHLDYSSKYESASAISNALTNKQDIKEEKDIDLEIKNIKRKVL